MNTPFYDSLRQLAAQNTARFHMPGHKGRPVFADFAPLFAIDFTETYDTGNLYEGEGRVRQAEQSVAAYYGAADCHFLTSGSSQGVQAMLGAFCGDGGKVLLDRTSHKSAMHACALFDLLPEFLLPDLLPYAGCGGVLDLGAAERLMQAHPDARALMIVSPNYYGVLQPVAELAELCHRYGKKLLVDGAHGAHLPALGLPVMQGADAVVLSAHKTLPALGQGSYLLLGADADSAVLRRFEAMCGTSSPSYPILASLELAYAALSAHAPAYQQTAAAVSRLRAKYDGARGLRALTSMDAPLDPLRLTVSCADGLMLSDHLYEKYGIAAEMADRHNLVFIITPHDLESNLPRLEAALDACLGEQPLSPTDFVPAPAPVRACSVRRALLSCAVALPPGQAVGRVCARPVTPYPPGVPILWPGEEIKAKHVEFLTDRCYNIVGEVMVCP